MARILVLTEDSASDAHAVLRAILLKMLKQVDEDAQTHRLDLHPTEDRQVRAVMHANRWRGADLGSERDRRTMVATIYERLFNGQFVAVHFDGDQVWSRRAESTIAGVFQDRVVIDVRRLLAARLDAIAVEAALSRLLVVQPFYSVEGLRGCPALVDALARSWSS